MVRLHPWAQIVQLAIWAAANVRWYGDDSFIRLPPTDGAHRRQVPATHRFDIIGRSETNEDSPSVREAAGVAREDSLGECRTLESAVSATSGQSCDGTGSFINVR